MKPSAVYPLLAIPLAVAGSAAAGAAGASVVGVHPADLHAYQPFTKDGERFWKCLSDPSIVLRYDQINDDYCDCPDGSDEPGTNACPSSAGRKPFYCANEGHIPGSLEHFKVNDGVCDYEVCCDGSDEAASACPNKCSEIHQQYVRFKQDTVAQLQGSLEQKARLESEGARLRRELEESAESYASIISRDEQTLAELREKLIEAEARAAREGSSGSGEGDESSAGSSAFDLLRPSIDRLASLHSAYEARLAASTDKVAKLEQILGNLIHNYNPNFNDAAVKQAVATFQDYVSNSDGDGDGSAAAAGETKHKEESAALVAELTAQSKAYSKAGAGEQASAAESAAVAGQPAAAGQSTWAFNEPPTFSNMAHYYYHRVISSFLDAPVELGEEEEEPAAAAGTSKASSAATKALFDEIEALQKEIKDKQASLAAIQGDLAVDYGAKDILRSVKGSWVSNKLGEYIYKLGFFESIYQDGNGNNVHIGRFSKMEDGYRLVYIHGSKCWNGPQRSAKVQLLCGPETKLVSVSEPEKCEYYFELLTPLVCKAVTEAELLSSFKIDYDQL